MEHGLISLEQFLGLIDDVEERPTRWTGACPVDPRHRLSVIPGTKNPFITFCSGPCSFLDILNAARMRQFKRQRGGRQ